MHFNSINLTQKQKPSASQHTNIVSINKKNAVWDGQIFSHKKINFLFKNNINKKKLQSKSLVI